MKVIAYTIATILVMFVLIPQSAAAQCIGTSPVGEVCDKNLYINIPCYQRYLLDKESCSCVYYCADKPINIDYSGDGPIDVDPFDTDLEITSARGIATLVTTSLQVFLGVVAIYAVYLAIRSAVLLANAGDSGAYEQAKKNMTYGVIGLFICGAGLIILQLVINFFGLGNLNDVFQVLVPALDDCSGVMIGGACIGG